MINIDKVQSYIAYNSITDEKISASAADDNNKPFTYIEWLERVSVDTKNTQDYTSQYNQYLQAWSAVKKLNNKETTNVIQSRYKTLLKDITLNYTTSEEKRFLSNININNIRHVESALPFYVSKIKQITIYVCKQRDDLKRQRITQSSSSSIEGTARAVSTTVLNEFISPDVDNNTMDVDNDVEFNVNIVELYDLSTNYFKQNNIPYNSKLYSADVEIIKSVLNECKPKLVLSSSVNLILAGNTTDSPTQLDLDYVNHSEFFNYIKSFDNLNRYIQQEYVSNLLGSNVYSLSAGALTLIEEPSKPWRNYLNRHTLSINDKHDTTNLSRIQDVGGFFTPSNTGLLTFYSHKPRLQITDTSIIVDKVQDVYKHGNSILSNTTSNPVDHIEDVLWVKADISNEKLHGDIVDDELAATFTGYTSQDELTPENLPGISKSTDQFSFFEGHKKTEWSNSDIFPLESSNIYKIDEKQQSLLTGHQTQTKWRTDIYGNEFALYKKIQRPRFPLDAPPGDDEYEVIAECVIIDCGDTLKELPPLYSDDVNFIIYEGGRTPGVDPKIEQLVIPQPFPDLRRVSELDESGNEVLEEFNSHYYGRSVTEDSPDLSITPVMFHGFDRVQYDSQAYSGMFTDTTCGILAGVSKECVLADSYSFGLYTEEQDGSGNYISLEYPTGDADRNDAFEEYINPGFEGYDYEVGFSNYGIPEGSNITIIDGDDVDGKEFLDTFCEDVPGEYEYTLEEQPLYLQTLNVSETKYASNPESVLTEQLSLYKEKTETTGTVYFRPYNSIKVTDLQTAMKTIIRNFDFFDNSDYFFLKQSIERGEILNMDVVYDCLILETFTHLYITKLNFDSSTGELLPNNTVDVLFRTTGDDNQVETCLGWFFDEINNRIITGHTSKSTYNNEMVVYPRLFEVDLNTLEYKQAHPNINYTDQTPDLFSLTDELSSYVVEHVDKPVISYDMETNIYNVSYSAKLSSYDNVTYSVFSNDYRKGQYNYRLIDNRVFHSETTTRYTDPGPRWNRRVDSKQIRLLPETDLIPSNTNPHTVQTQSVSSMLGYVLSGYQFDLDVYTKTIPVKINGFKLIRIIFDPDDGTPAYVNDRTIIDGTQALTFDITELPDQSDFGDPRRVGFKHKYFFDKSTPHTYVATVSAIYTNFQTLTYRILIDTTPYTTESAFTGVKLIDSKIYMNGNNSEQLLVLETQDPKYITNVTIDR